MIKFIRNLFDASFYKDAYIALKGYINFQLNGFTLEERKNIYKNLSHCLKDEEQAEKNKGSEAKVTIKQMYFDLARAEEILKPRQYFLGREFKNKKAERLRSISAMSQYPRTRTPHADSLRPYIPKSEFNMLRNAERVQGMLAHALKYATITGEQDAAIKALNMKVFGRYFMIFAFNAPAVLFAREIIDFMSPLGIPNDSFTRGVLSICDATVDLAPYLFLFVAIYVLFYQLYKTSIPNELRSHFDAYPLFSSYKLRNSSITLINLAIEKSLSRGTVMTKIILNMAIQYKPYIKSHLNNLAALTTKSSFSAALGESSMLPKELKATIVRSHIIMSSESEIIKSSVDSVKNLIKLREKIFESTQYLSVALQFLYPTLLTAQNIVAGGNISI